MDASGIVFPESPRWRESRFWFVDMFGQRVLTMDLAGHIVVVAENDGNLSGLGFLPNGDAIVVDMHRRQLLRLNESNSVYADLGSLPGSHLNDMIVDNSGRAYVDCLQPRSNLFSRRDVGDSIVLVEPDGNFRIATKGDVIRPNGLAVTPDAKTLIVAETLANRLTAFAIEEDGSLGERRVYADTADRRPDGICIDEAGAVWYGSPLTEEFVRVFPGGEVAQVIPVPGRWAIACVLGGPDRRTLFMTSAKVPTHEGPGLGYKLEQAEGFVSLAAVAVPGVGCP